MVSDWLRARGLGGYDEDAPGARRYMTGEICLNGHPTTGSVEELPEVTAKFCPECGNRTIRACPDCNAPIRGEYLVRGVAAGVFGYTAPNHCHNCGAAFPWTRARIDAAKEHAAEIDGLDDGERKQLQGVIDDLAIGGARTELAASRFKRLMHKAGQKAGSGLYQFVVDVVSETAKKALSG